MERDFGLYVFTILYRAMRPDFYPHSTRQSRAYFPTEPPPIPLTTDRCLALLAGIKGRSGRLGHVQTQCPTKAFPLGVPQVHGNYYSTSKCVPFIASTEVLLLIWQVEAPNAS